MLCEAVWVLVRTYRYTCMQALDAVAAILSTRELVGVDREAVEAALEIFAGTRADFAEALIGVLNRRAGCATTYTFDRRAAATADFTTIA